MPALDAPFDKILAVHAGLFRTEPDARLAGPRQPSALRSVVAGDLDDLLAAVDVVPPGVPDPAHGPV